MGWRAAIRQLEADARRSARNTERHRRAVEKQRLYDEKVEERERVRDEVELHESWVEFLASVHRDCGRQWDWRRVLAAGPPTQRLTTNECERKAREALANYKPGFWDWFLARGGEKRDVLREAIKAAKLADRADERAAADEYHEALESWQNGKEFARRILAGDIEAYSVALNDTRPFRDVPLLPRSIVFTLPRPATIQVQFNPDAKGAIPAVVKRQLATGKLSVRAMPQSQYQDLYRDYVCSCLLRVARELFAILPIDMAIITAFRETPDLQTGHLINRPMLSAAIPRPTVDGIRWDTVHPTACMSNFLHRMEFGQPGASNVTPITLSDL